MKPSSVRLSETAITRFAERTSKALRQTIAVLEREYERAASSVDVIGAIPIQLELEQLYRLQEEQTRIAQRLRSSVEFVQLVTN